MVITLRTLHEKKNKNKKIKKKKAYLPPRCWLDVEASLNLGKILFYELKATIDTLRHDEGFSHFASRREILNDKFLDIWKFKRSINLNIVIELLFLFFITVTY